jgi:hypothetical protein
MVLSAAIQGYFDYARHDLGHSPTTHLSYQSWLRNFARWLGENGAIDPAVREISRHPRRAVLPIQDSRVVK